MLRPLEVPCSSARLLAAAGAVAVSLSMLAAVFRIYESRKAKDSRLRLELLSSAVKEPWRRVFLNHTGQDETAKHFTASVLKPALQDEGLDVVIDFEFLKPGVDWTQELEEAAANCKVFVAVLSKQYYTRYWCMLELDLALNAHEQLHGRAKADTAPLIIPVFLDSCNIVVCPWRIKAYWSWQQVCSWVKQELGRIDAACWAANMAHMLLKQNLRLDCFQGKQHLRLLAREVVSEAVRKMPPLLDDGNPVGLDDEVQTLQQMLQTKLGVWISGIGGTGKTTLGKRLFNRLLSTGVFASTVFIPIKESDGDCPDRMAFHLSRALKRLHSKEHLGQAADALSGVLKDRVRNQPVLYMLDNVCTVAQLDHMLPLEWALGSRVIITSRLEDMSWPPIQELRQQVQFHQVGGLDSGSSRNLFRNRAGVLGPLPERLEHLEDALLRWCAGLPLALQVVGGRLFGNLERGQWQSVLGSLQQSGRVAAGSDRLQGIIGNSLRGMHAEAVSMFLDVATVLRGWSFDDAMAVWEAWHGPAARDCFTCLQQCSLIRLDKARRLQMHDVVAALGRGMVLDNGGDHHGTRLWVEGGQVMGVPQARDKTYRVFVAQLDVRDIASGTYRDCRQPLPVLDSTAAAQLDWSEVKILQAGRADVRLPSSLLWLDVSSWQQLRAAGGCAPLNGLQNLRALHLDDCSTLAGLPACLGNMVGLQRFVLSGGCGNLLGGLEHIASLPALRVLHLESCTKLRSLPEVLKLPNLQELRLTGYQCMEPLPASWLVHLTELRCLDLSGCSQLASIPESLGKLVSLEELHLNGCTRLEALPGCISKLTLLQELHLDECHSLRQLPDAVAELSSLCCLRLSRCHQLGSLPKSLGKLGKTLQQLILVGCDRLEDLPASVEQLSESARSTMEPIYTWHRTGVLHEKQHAERQRREGLQKQASAGGPETRPWPLRWLTKAWSGSQMEE